MLKFSFDTISLFCRRWLCSNSADSICCWQYNLSWICRNVVDLIRCGHVAQQVVEQIKPVEFEHYQAVSDM